MGEDREDVQEMKGSALEVCPSPSSPLGRFTLHV